MKLEKNPGFIGGSQAIQQVNYLFMFGRPLVVSSFRWLDKSLSSMTRWPRRTLISCICLRRTRIWWYRWGLPCGGEKESGSLAEGVGSGGSGSGGFVEVVSGASAFWGGAGVKAVGAAELEGPGLGAGDTDKSEARLALPLILLVNLSYSLKAALEPSGSKTWGLWSKFQSEEIWISFCLKIFHKEALSLKGLWIIASSSSLIEFTTRMLYNR